MENDQRDILRLTNCPRCGYKLEGLQSRGRCPECGLRYNEEMWLFSILPHSWRMTRRANTIPIILIILGVIKFIFDLSKGSIPLFPNAFLVLGVSLILLNWKVRSVLERRRVQTFQQFDEQHQAIFFNSRGVALRKQGRLLTLWPWSCFDKYTLEEFDSGVWRLKLSPAMWRPTLAPTIDADIFLGSEAEFSTKLRKEIQRWLDDSHTKVSKA